MSKITIYTIGQGNVFAGDVEIEVNDPIKSPIPANHTRTSPHPIPANHYAVMSNGWQYIEGQAPIPSPTDYSAQNKEIATQLLLDTDWTEYPSVADKTKNPHLVNLNDFVDYRVAVRAIAVNPPTTPAEFPNKPVEQWS